MITEIKFFQIVKASGLLCFIIMKTFLSLRPDVLEEFHGILGYPVSLAVHPTSLSKLL